MLSLPTCTRRIEFDAGHRLVGHESKCKYVHGHRYVLEATFAADTLDTLGRVIDFAVIKDRLTGWIDTHWDHALILWEQDKALGEHISQTTGQPIFYLAQNPTAEHMAAYLFHDVCPSLFASEGAHCVRLRLYETPNAYVEVGA